MLSRTFVIKKLQALAKSNCAALPKRTSAVERKAWISVHPILGYGHSYGQKQGCQKKPCKAMAKAALKPESHPIFFWKAAEHNPESRTLICRIESSTSATSPSFILMPASMYM